jgi:List-Bact-rpt repeat protein
VLYGYVRRRLLWRPKSRPATGTVRLISLVVAASVTAFVCIASASAVPSLPLHGSISVSKNGTGSGSVSSNPNGIDCGDTCAWSFVSDDDPDYDPVSLTASADPGSKFTGWGGSCSGSGGCVIDPVKRLESYGVTATFTADRPNDFPLAVSVSGKGKVTSEPSRIDCGPTCSALFPTDSAVTLTATPIPGWSFAGWGGACSGSGACTVTMSAPLSVTATFAPPETAYALAVSVEGAGSVTSDIEGISCGSSCTSSYGIGVTVRLTAAGSNVSWGGACSGGRASCAVTMNGPNVVTAAFEGKPLSRAPLAVAVVGKGSISSEPAGVACGDVCGALFPIGSGVTLTTTAAEGWIFAGWKGACTGVSKTCRAVLNAPKTAIATFVEAGTGYPLAVTTAGQGSVRSRPAGIACGATCASSFLAGSTIMLEALPQKGSKFVRWSGACTGSKPRCPVGVDGPKSVAATFAKLADQIAPTVNALPSSGQRGRIARLRYRVTEKSGRSREWATIYGGGKPLGTVRGRLDEVETGVLYYFLPWRVPLTVLPGASLRFCVRAVDPTGNRGGPSCASLRIR